ncbi:MAG: GNAT family N-acetyltransferase [Pseudomonadota bacterium]|nr:GNAT family N-acetyltransferase [Pseudomonadota bacterium]
MTFRPIETERLVIRNWREEDRDLFHAINSDDRVMEYFPFRRDRAAADRVMDLLASAIERDGHGFTALERRDTGECIGFAGLARASLEGAGFPQDMIEIGWRLHHPWWGLGFAGEAAHAWLQQGFGELGLDEIVSFAVHDNDRSTAVMRRIGMRRDPARDFDHAGVPETHPHLRRHVFYALTREEWLHDRERSQS